MEDQIKALTEGFLSMTTMLTQAPASGPLMQLEKFKPAKNTARDWIKDYEEAATMSNWVDNTKKDRFPFYLSSGAAKQWFDLKKTIR